MQNREEVWTGEELCTRRLKQQSQMRPWVAWPIKPSLRYSTREQTLNKHRPNKIHLFYPDYAILHLSQHSDHLLSQTPSSEFSLWLTAYHRWVGQQVCLFRRRFIHSLFLRPFTGHCSTNTLIPAREDNTWNHTFRNVLHYFVQSNSKYNFFIPFILSQKFIFRVSANFFGQKVQRIYRLWL